MPKFRTISTSNYKGFEAKFPGTCGLCDKPIKVGQRITPLAMKVYSHYHCQFTPKSNLGEFRGKAKPHNY